MPDFLCKEDYEYIEVAGTRQAYHANKEKYNRFKEEYPYLNFSIVKLYNNTIEKTSGNGKPTSDYDHSVPPKWPPNKTQIAKKFKISNSLVTDISKKRRYTRDRNLALQLAAITGDKPINYIHPSMRDAYKTAYPILADRVKEEIVIIKR